jgi:protease-4
VKQFLVTLAGVFAGLLLFFVGLPMVLIASAIGASKPAPTPADTVLALDLRGPLSDQDSQAPFAFGGPADSVLGIVRTLDRAEEGPQGQGAVHSPAKRRHGPGRRRGTAAGGEELPRGRQAGVGP